MYILLISFHSIVMCDNSQSIKSIRYIILFQCSTLVIALNNHRVVVLVVFYIWTKGQILDRQAETSSISKMKNRFSKLASFFKWLVQEDKNCTKKILESTPNLKTAGTFWKMTSFLMCPAFWYYSNQRQRVSR